MRKFYLLFLIFYFLSVSAYAHNIGFFAGRAGINSFFGNDVPGDAPANNNHNNFKSNTFFACSTPTGLSAGSVTTTTTSISFTSGGTSFVVEYGPTGFTPGTGATAGTNGTVVTGSASPVGLTGLANGTTYQVYVRQDCGVDGYSANAGPVSFTTVCGLASLPYFENFDGVTVPAVPNCMAVENVNGGNTWRTVSTDYFVSSPNIMRLDYELDNVTPANDWFYTKGLFLTGGTSYHLKFNYRNSDADVFIEKLEVKYGLAANAPSMTSGTLYSNTHIDFNLWLEAVVDFTPSVTGVYYIGFHGFSDADQAYLAIDNISVDATTCFSPTALTVKAASPTIATLNWTAASPAPSSGYEWKIVAAGANYNSAAVTGGFTGAGVTTANATGLDNNTSYDLFVRSYCGGTDSSGWTGPKNFKLMDDAPGAITLTVNAGCTGAIYTNVGARAGVAEVYPSCSGTIEAPVWFKFKATSTAVRISTDIGSGNTFTNSKLGLFSTTDSLNYGTFTILSCDDDGGSALGAGNMSVLYATGLTIGNTYWIAVDKFNNGTANGTFCIAVDSLTSNMLATANTCVDSYQQPTGAVASYNGWAPLLDANSNLIALVKNAAGGEVDDYTVSQNIHSGAIRNDGAGRSYLDRNFWINNTTATNVQVQFFFTNTELTALKAVDSAVTLANIGATRMAGSCQADFSGTGSYLAQTARDSTGGAYWIQVTTPGFSNFYLHTSKTPVTLKTFLQGAYAGAGLHKAVTATWRDVLRNNATSQPYNITAFGNYNGGENVPALTFDNTTSTDILDWVLIELRSAAPPAAPIASRAAFIREDGAIVDLDGVSSVSFRGVPNGSYYITIRHRNHLGIRTATLQSLDGSLGSNTAPAVYDFSTAQNKAVQVGTVTTNAAMAQNGTVFMMWAGNANLDNAVRAITLGIPFTQGDGVYILGTILAGNPNATGPLTGTPGYSPGDVNFDGRVRATTLGIPFTPSDVGFILGTPLNGVSNATRREHK